MRKGNRMRATRTLPLAVLAAAAALVLPSAATAHPTVCQEENVVGGAFFTAAFAMTGPGEEGDACFSAEQIATFDDSGADLQPGETARTRNVHLLANLPKQGIFAPESAFNSDIAFQGTYAYRGNYEGIQVTNIADPENPVDVGFSDCVGAQNDVSVYGDVLVASVDSSRAFAECFKDGVRNFSRSATNKDAWEGIRVFDISNPAEPKYVTAVETDCGSHTHTILPDGDRLLVYVSSYSPSPSFPDCQPPHDKISVVEIPLANKAGATLIGEPVLFPDGGFPGAPGRSATSGCHDITVYPAIGLAAGACMGQGVLMDIRTDPANPKVISSVTDPNFAFWHSATFFNDGTKVLFTDELGGGGGPTCNPSVGPVRGANAIYDITDPASPQFVSYYKIPRTQSNKENCVAHNGVFLPTSKGDTYVQAWYQGGTSIVDMNDPAAPKEVGFFDRGPISNDRLVLGGSWSSYYYNGFIYANDIQRGLDVLKFSDPRAAGAGPNKVQRLNAQVQEPLRK
jgi:hypothetical protein